VLHLYGLIFFLFLCPFLCLMLLDVGRYGLICFLYLALDLVPFLWTKLPRLVELLL
jgi:hypothetical protein